MNFDTEQQQVENYTSSYELQCFKQKLEKMYEKKKHFMPSKRYC